MKRDVHIVPHGDTWAVRREGANRVSSTHDTQREAIDVGRRTAQREHTELVIHGRGGKIRNSNSFGSDPCPPRDKRH